jgi:uncharacterized membrane protein YgaE (UPF0421/DUF939 family)
VGIRVIKTAIAVWAAVAIAQAIGLQSPVSAGFLAILGIDVTIRKGLRTATERIVASILGLLCASLMFYVFGFHIWVFSAYILLVYPALSRLKLRDGIVTSSVVAFHLLSAQSVTAYLIMNEIGLLLVGLGTATIINIVYMPNPEKELKQLRQEVETSFSDIFIEISRHLKNVDYVWNGMELLDAHRKVEQGAALAKRSMENALLHDDPAAWSIYYQMRRVQLESIQRMVQLVAQVFEKLQHGELLAGVFEELSVDVKGEYYTGRCKRLLDRLDDSYSKMPLPATRQEFETRSALLQLSMELHTYLETARRDKKKPADGAKPANEFGE